MTLSSATISRCIPNFGGQLLCALITETEKLFPRSLFASKGFHRSHFKLQMNVYGLFLLLVILFMYISNVIPLPSLPSANSVYPLFTASPCFYEGAPPPAHPLLSALTFPYPESLLVMDQGAPHLVMPERQSSATYLAGAMGPQLWLVV